MAKKTETKIEKIEKEYIIPLREKIRVVPRYKKTNKAVKTIKEFLARHMKVRDRDLNKIKLDSYLNEFLWSRGIKNPPHKIKVKAIKEGENIRVELSEMPKKLMLKKTREEKIEKIGEEIAKKKKESEKKAEEKEKKEESDIKEEEEKKAAVVEAGKKIEKAAARKIKHTSKKQEKSPVVQRKALAR